ncbi:hypothetical protein ACP70R_047951 [Stipagrostis hirtigluma subsp. patula]
MVLPFPPLPGPLFAPRQVNEQSIPMLLYDVHNGPEEYIHMLEVREQRFLAIGATSFLDVPITPLHTNPETGHSHHILRLTNSWVDETSAVDLLFRDQNTYFIAFRRVINGVGGQWYKFHGEDVPDFLHAEDIEKLHSGHESGDVTTIGGIMTFDDVFHTFFHYNGEAVDDQLIRAKARAIVIFSEALRFLCVRQLVAQRMASNANAAILPGVIWRRMLSWQVLSDFLLDTMRRFLLPEGHPDRQPHQGNLARLAEPYDIFQLEDLIGPNGDIRLILRRVRSMIEPHVLEQERQQPQAAQIVEPGF